MRVQCTIAGHASDKTSISNSPRDRGQSPPRDAAEAAAFKRRLSPLDLRPIINLSRCQGTATDDDDDDNDDSSSSV
ncbi:uncharacterized protein DMAD_10554 [Drosophila madeirensis]|uniref:Uncharacterized protein n=1 Tax=Drosophila madeirensis TaxID=30013 RepID=A0AAU9F9Z8_DROMD